LADTEGIRERYAGLITEGRAAAMAEPKALNRLKDGEEATVCVRVLEIPCQKTFERNGKPGRLCSMRVADKTAEGSLVLWNRDAAMADGLRRNDAIEARNVLVKTASPVELHSILITEIEKTNGDGGALPPTDKTPFLKIAELRGGVPSFDFEGHLLEKSGVRLFEKNGRKGSVANLVIGDGDSRIATVCWDANAEYTERLRPGDAVLVEGAYLKNGEAHVGKGRIVRDASRERDEDAAKRLYPRRKISELEEGETALVEGDVSAVFEARVIKKCRDCGAKKPCACGGAERDLLLATAEIRDDTGSLRCAFFDEEARSLLGIKLTGVEVQTLLEIKRDYIKGRKIAAVVLPKIGLSGRLEGVAKKLL